MYRPENFTPLQIQSQGVFNNWARGNVSSFGAYIPNTTPIPAAAVLTGADLSPNKPIDPIARSNNRHLELIARTVAERGTLNQRHVNLESNVGQYLKQSMGLPYQTHSRVDPMAAALQARETFAEFTKKFKTTIDNGILQLWGLDTKSSFIGRVPSLLADIEIQAHGGPVEEWGGAWGILNAQGGVDLAQGAVSKALEQENVSSVLLTACNIDRSFVHAPQGKRIIQGLGQGFHRTQLHEAIAKEGFGGYYSWRDAVVMHQGETAYIFPKSAVHAELARLGRHIPMEEGQGTVGIFRDLMDKGGGVRIGMTPAVTSRKALMLTSLPMEETPYIAARGFNAAGKGGIFQLPTGETFGTLEEASATLTGRLRVAAGLSTLGPAAASLKSAGVGESEALAKVVGSESARTVSGKNYKGILIGGVMAIGSSILLKGWETLNESVHQHIHPTTPQTNNYGNYSPSKRDTELFSILRTHQDGPDGETKLVVDDAKLDHTTIDRMFTSHLKRGFATA